MVSKAYKEYFDLQSKINALEEKKTALRTSILEDMNKKGAVKVESDFGTFSIVESVKYVFDAEAKQAIADAKKMTKKLELQYVTNGHAQEVPTKTLRFMKND